MSLVSSLKRSIKEMNGEKLTKWDNVQECWYNLWQYTWGFRHLRTFKYAMKHLFWDRYDLISTKLPKTKYHDTPVLVLYGMMNLLVEFVEVEKCFEVIDFDNGEQWKESGNIIKEVYDWWKDYPNREKEIEISLNNWYKSSFEKNEDFIDAINRRSRSKEETPESKRYSKIHEYLEENLKKEETEMLMKVIKIRDFLWT